MTGDVISEAARQSAEGRPYVLATVVRVVRPVSARVGDRALVTADGRLQGWVGGACSEPAVVREALRALADGEPRLLRIGARAAQDESGEDVVFAESSCASEGTLDVFVEPRLPAPLVAVVGESPAATTLAELARVVGWRVARDVDERAEAVVVATMGRGDEEALARALRADAPYVALVASARRAAAVLDSLRAGGLDEDALLRVRSPAGLDLGPVPQPEIAVAILAELVAWRHDLARAPAALPEAVDPVCGMTLNGLAAHERAVHRGVEHVFCCAGCRAAFLADPEQYAGARPA